jgi:maltose/moltooligosaccharide transporter
VLLAIVTLLWRERLELYLIAALAALLGIGQWAAAWSARHGERPSGLLEIIDDVLHMPSLMRRLAVVQFFTWFGLFALWVYAVPALAGSAPPTSAAYNEAADWVGVLFAFYNGVAAIGAAVLPMLARRLGRQRTHALCLALGALGLLGFALARSHDGLWPAALAIGCAWSSILALPYAMVASAVPPTRMGVYMGIHNIFLVLPQLVAAALLGWIVERLLGGQARLALVLAAASIAVAALAALTLPDATARDA